MMNTEGSAMFGKCLKFIPIALSMALVVAFMVTAGAVPISTEIESDSNTSAFALTGLNWSPTGSSLSLTKTAVLPLSWTYGGVTVNSWMATFESQGEFGKQEFTITAEELFPYFGKWNSEEFYGYTSANVNICLRYYRRGDVDTGWYPDTISHPEVQIYYSENGISNHMTAYDNYYVDNDSYITYVYSFSIYFSEPELIESTSLFTITIDNPPDGDASDFAETFMSIGIMDNTTMNVYYNYDDRPPEYDFNDPNKDIVNELWGDVRLPTIDNAVGDTSSNDVFNTIFSLDVVEMLGLPLIVSAMGLFAVKVMLFKG